MGFVLQYFNNDLDLFFKVCWYVGTLLTIIYFIIIPESPKWYFINDGSGSKRGIEALNYIAIFNGSQFRIPEHARFDLFG